jgi:uncharacterized membrane protein YfcA
MAFLLEFFLQVVLQLVGEAMLALGWESVAASARERSKANPVLAGVGYLLIGLVLGAISGALYPRRIAEDMGVSLLGVFVNPALFGLLAFQYGQRKRRRDQAATHLATFWGGASFAFGFSAARLAVIIAMTSP